MWKYEKRLQFPVNIRNKNPRLAKLIVTQLGGADGELGASNRYLHQRYAMPYSEIKEQELLFRFRLFFQFVR